MEKRVRVKWIDVLKCIGIFEIYLGHFGEVAGKLYPFVFTHHVPLFFFISGCVENYNKDAVWKTVQKKFITLLVPFYFFGILSIVFHCIYYDMSFYEIYPAFIELLKGAIRNNFLPGSLWFLSASFIMCIVFRIISLIKLKWLMLAISLLIYSGMYTVYGTDIQHLPYNLDSVFNYLVFYVAGYIFFPLINKFIEQGSRKKKFLYYLVFLTCFVYTSLVYFQKNNFILLPVSENKFICAILELISIFLIIFFFTMVSACLQNVSLLNIVGESSLYLCGNEYIIKMLFAVSLWTISLAHNIQSPLGAVLTTCVLLALVIKFLVPWQKYIFQEIRCWYNGRSLAE